MTCYMGPSYYSSCNTGPSCYPTYGTSGYNSYYTPNCGYSRATYPGCSSYYSRPYNVYNRYFNSCYSYPSYTSCRSYYPYSSVGCTLSALALGALGLGYCSSNRWY